MQENNVWMNEEDAVLAEIALKHVRIGSHELKAFSEAADRVGRKVSDCYYRWNCIVRENYEEQLNKAKTERTRYIIVTYE